MQKPDIIRFFDQYAPQWDADMIIDDQIVAVILENAGVSKGKRCLDVACGTGVLTPYYLEREVASVTGVDISPEMIRIAMGKFHEPNVHFICGDFETEVLGQNFDCVVVYNSFPHFADPQKAVSVLAGLLAPGGMLTVAHGMSREAINRHHSGAASQVSIDLLSAEALSQLFSKHLDVTTLIDNDQMYQVAGKRS
jgi:ubiquinone/menaquinone biosynthesis C-methylase UbiE